jgi:hypothetical protein
VWLSHWICPRRLQIIPHATLEVLTEVAQERARQDATYGAQRHLPLVWPGRHYLPSEQTLRSRYEWAVADGTVAHGEIILEELGEALHAQTREQQRAELVQTAACVVKAIEALDWQAAQALLSK